VTTGADVTAAVGALPSATARTALASAGAFMLATCVTAGFGVSTTKARTVTSGFSEITRAFERSDLVVGAGAITVGAVAFTRGAELKLLEICGGGLITSGVVPDRAERVVIGRPAFNAGAGCITSASPPDVLAPAIFMPLMAGAGGITASGAAEPAADLAARIPFKAGVAGIAGANAATAGIFGLAIRNSLTIGAAATPVPAAIKTWMLPPYANVIFPRTCFASRGVKVIRTSQLLNAGIPVEQELLWVKSPPDVVCSAAILST